MNQHSTVSNDLNDYIKFLSILVYILFKFFTREKLNSMNLLMYMGPVACVILLPAALFMEENVVGITIALARDDVSIVWYLIFNSALAYFVNLTNFLVTKHTSPLTLQVYIIPLHDHIESKCVIHSRI